MSTPDIAKLFSRAETLTAQARDATRHQDYESARTYAELARTYLATALSHLPQ
jgi:hypothetical protein